MSAALPSLEPAGEMPGGEEPPPLVVASNRLPVRWDATEERWVRSSGGLVTALEPLIRRAGGVWVGWGDGPERPRLPGVHLEPVH